MKEVMRVEKEKVGGRLFIPKAIISIPATPGRRKTPF
jgi:hypothetical protein